MKTKDLLVIRPPSGLRPCKTAHLSCEGLNHRLAGRNQHRCTRNQNDAQRIKMTALGLCHVPRICFEFYMHIKDAKTFHVVFQAREIISFFDGGRFCLTSFMKLRLGNKIQHYCSLFPSSLQTSVRSHTAQYQYPPAFTYRPRIWLVFQHTDPPMKCECSVGPGLQKYSL